MATLSESADHFNAVDVGQSQVENDQVGVFGRRHLQRGGPGAGRRHSVTAAGEVQCQRPQQVRFVVDDEHVRHAARGLRLAAVGSGRGGHALDLSAESVASSPMG